MEMRQSRILITILCTALILNHQNVDASALEEMSTERIKPSSAAFGAFSSSLLSPLTLNSLAGSAQLGRQSSFRFATGMFHKSAKGVKRVRLIQTYGGYDVFGSAAEAEMDANDRFTGQMHGEVVRNIHRSIRNPEACQRKVSSLQNLAIRMERLNPADPNIDKRDARRIIYAGSSKGRARLAYKVQFFYMGEERITHPVYFFDACTGFVLTSYDLLKNMTKYSSPSSSKGTKNVPSYRSPIGRKTGASSCSVSAAGVGGNIKIGKITYNTPPFCLDVQRSLSFCRMEGIYSRVVDNQQSGRIDNQNVVSFLCANGYNDPINEAFGVANDALYYGEIAGRFFEERFGFRALSYKPRLVVHFRSQFDNAIWDGTDMYFGDGFNFFYPLTSLNVVAHELAHGVTTTNSNLIYRGMSGGINEAFSDITGETTEFYARNSVDWLIGSDIVKESTGIEALRFFVNPPDDGRSIKYSIQFRPFMNVHFSSGVFNHAFYRMVVTEGMNMYEAYKCFLDANLNLWKPFTGFFSGACNVMQAAYDNGFNHRKVRRAFFHVGIPLIFCRYAALTTAMFPGETRREILVSATRSPILKVELDPRASNSTSVRVTADDNSEIQVVVGKDDEASQVISSGENEATIDSTLSKVYVRLASTNPNDVKVTVKVVQ